MATQNVSEKELLTVSIAGAELTLLSEGALWWAKEAMLVVSDLHLEKGSSYAAKGQLLPPYDTGATLSSVELLCERLSPRICISLGDSFHDVAAEERLSVSDTRRIQALCKKTDWLWVEGNHDPDPPQSLGGRAMKEVRLDGLVFRHEPTGEFGEVAGHLHPVARVSARGRHVRRKCFASDGKRLILPALGALTGGLNVCDDAFGAVFPDGLKAYALGQGRVYPLDTKRLQPDGARRH